MVWWAVPKEAVASVVSTVSVMSASFFSTFRALMLLQPLEYGLEGLFPGGCCGWVASGNAFTNVVYLLLYDIIHGLQQQLNARTTSINALEPICLICGFELNMELHNPPGGLPATLGGLAPYGGSARYGGGGRQPRVRPATPRAHAGRSPRPASDAGRSLRPAGRNPPPQGGVPRSLKYIGNHGNTTEIYGNT